MNSIAIILAPVALMLPVVAAEKHRPFPKQDDTAQLTSQTNKVVFLPALDDKMSKTLRSFFGAHQPPVARQVRIERRVILRIAPRDRGRGAPGIADFSVRPRSGTATEQKRESCIPVDAIAGVQPLEDDRLLLFLRNNQVFGISLERTCSARDFYSGFYLERNADGRLCSGRDHLQSRTGANCEVTALNQFVAKSEIPGH